VTSVENFTSASALRQYFEFLFDLIVDEGGNSNRKVVKEEEEDRSTHNNLGERNASP